MKYNNILLFSIPSTLKTGHFIDYFINNSSDLYLIMLPLSTQPPLLVLNHYRKNELVGTKNFHVYKGNNKILRNLFFYFYYLYIIFFILPRKTIILATTPQYCFFYCFFDFIKSIKIVYHVGDYYANQKGLMKIYQFLIHTFNKQMPYVVYCSPVIKSLLAGNKKPVDGNRDCWVFGIENKNIKKNVIENLMGYIGVLRSGQGLDIILNALKTNENLTLEVIGDGPSFNYLKNEIEKLNLTNRVKLFGLVKDEKQISDIVGRWQIGLAPYDPGKTNMTYYAEPSKIKFYLEYQLPVIMTRVTYIHKELEKFQAGINIDFNSDSLLKAIDHIQKHYGKFSAGAKRLAKNYEFGPLYDRQFKFMTNIWHF